MDGVKRELTVREAAQVLGINLDTIYKLLWAGRIAATKNEGKWIIPFSAIEDRARRRAMKLAA